MAKSTYVWLDQLSRAYGRDIRTLDAIPDEELDTLAALGRHRAVADRPVGALEGVRADQADARQRRRGRLGLLARRLPDRRRPRRRGGLRRTCATAPGRAASASRATWSPTTWASTRAGSSSTRSGSCRCREPPYPVYTFAGPDLSADPRVGIVLEDHYWDDSDAAVVFKRFDRGDRRRRATSTTATTARASRGTTRPSSTSSTPAVREQVIQTILDVARRFPIIRFDAAMVLAKKHIQRLWWPEPGHRRRHPVARRARHPEGRVRRADAATSSGARSSTGSPPRSPARSCWPRRSGCSRATSSGRSACTASTTARSCTCSATRTSAGYRKVIKETIEFDPEILKRYVNFMSNPDEKTALEQFGKGDKYFGVATVLATLPGLPMLGHGQVQGFGEKYGMEFRRAMLDEQPDPWLVERHEREIFPLLHRRAWFAEATRLPAVRLRDDRRARRRGRPRLLERVGPRAVAGRLPHPVRRRRAGTIRDVRRSTRSRPPTGAKRMVRRSLAEGLGLPNDPAPSSPSATRGPGSSTSARAAELWERGLADLARRLRGPRLLGVPRGPRRRRRPVGAARRPARRRGRRRRSTTRCASSSSSRSTGRCGRSSPTA